MPIVSQTYDTSYGRVILAFSWIDGHIVTKMLNITLKNVRFENTADNMVLVTVTKDGRIGLPFFIHAHWTEFSAAIQAAVDMIDWGIIEVLLWDHALYEYEQEVDVIDRDVQAAADIKRYQLHVQGDVDRLRPNRDVRSMLNLLDEFFRNILTKRRK